MHTRFKTPALPAFWLALVAIFAVMMCVPLMASAVGTVAFQGTVTDASTTDPISDASVNAYYEDDANYYEGFASTDSSGHYELMLDAAAPSATYSIDVSADGYTGVSDAAAYAGSPVTKDFALTPKVTAFTGTVTDADTAGVISGAYVEVSYDDGSNGYYGDVNADEFGRYVLMLDADAPSAIYSIRVQADGYSEYSGTVAYAGSPVAKDFALTPKVTAFTGTVTDAVTADPISYVDVSVYYEDDTNYYHDYASTDESGHYELLLDANAPHATYDIYAYAHGYSDYSGTVAYAGSPVAKDIALAVPVTAITGTVTNANTTAVISDAYVEASYDDGANQYYGEVSADEFGNYVLQLPANAPHATYTIHAEADGYSSYSGTVAYAGSPVVKNIALNLLTADAYEVDDTVGQAKNLIVGAAVQQRTLYPAGDGDWVAFSAVAGHRYRIETTMTAGGGCCGTYLDLYASNGIDELGHDESSDGHLLSVIHYTATQTGTLFIKVLHTPEDPSGTGEYGLAVNDTLVRVITPNAGTNGSISPSVAQAVDLGGSKTFTITPAPGYHVADVLVDGSSIGPVTSYAFTGVTANHRISATFDINKYTIAPSAGANGSISPATALTVNHGAASPAFAITPAAGYHVADVLVDGVSVGAVSTYTFPSVTANHTISAIFAPTPVTRSTTTKLSGLASVKVRKTLKLKGTVSPSAASGKVTIVKTRLVGKKWKSMGSSKVSVKGGKYSYSFKPTKTGKWCLVAKYSGGKLGMTTYKASTSTVKNVKVK